MLDPSALALARRLADAFAAVEHDMGRPGAINASPDRWREVSRLLECDPDDWSLEDLDWLVCKSMTTVGGPQTLKVVLSRFLARAVVDERFAAGAVADSHWVLPRLADAGFRNWPASEREAMLDALDFWAEGRLALRASEPWEPDREDPGATEIREWVSAARHLA